MNSRRNWPLAGYNVLAFAFLLAPIAVVIATSFTSGSTLAFPPPGLSLRWFRYLAGRDEFVTAAIVSLQVALWASAGAVALGVPASLALARGRFRGKTIVEGALMSPLVLPGIITGVALLQYFTAAGLLRSFPRLVLAHIVICLPYSIRSVSAGLRGIDPALEEASRTLGAGRWRTFRRILLPLLRPGIIAATIFSFVTSFDNVVVSIYLIGADTVTLPIRILTYLEWQFDPSIAAISAIFVVVTVVVVAMAEAMTGVTNRPRPPIHTDLTPITRTRS
jgi:putative spermidine/putrescine transport system permease protein